MLIAWFLLRLCSDRFAYVLLKKPVFIFNVCGSRSDLFSFRPFLCCSSRKKKFYIFSIFNKTLELELSLNWIHDDQFRWKQELYNQFENLFVIDNFLIETTSVFTILLHRRSSSYAFSFHSWMNWVQFTRSSSMISSTSCLLLCHPVTWGLTSSFFYNLLRHR